jgi:hypothetical protein
VPEVAEAPGVEVEPGSATESERESGLEPGSARAEAAPRAAKMVQVVKPAVAEAATMA